MTLPTITGAFLHRSSTLLQRQPGQRGILRPRLRALAAIFGLVGFAVSFAGSWIPSYWGDEAASVMSAERSLPSLFGLLQQVDAVHGSYYLLLHFWIEAFGASELSVRLPSSLGVGAAVAGTVVLAQVLGSRRVAVYAGIVSTVLPRIGYMGGEARSYALATAVAVWLTAVLVLTVRGRIPGRRGWIAYAALLTLGVYLFLYLSLILLAHGLFLLAATKERRMRIRWLIASAASLILSLPVIVAGAAERHQIGWLAGSRGTVTLYHLLVTQWFGNPWLATLCWLLVVAAVWLAIGAARTRSRRNGQFVLLAAGWLVLPCAVLVGASVTVMPTYTERYLSFSAPAAALLIAFGLAALPRNGWLPLVAVTAIVALAVPTLVGQRLPFAKDDGSDWREASAYIGANAHPGDAIVFDDSVRPSRKPRSAEYLYPADYAGLNDVLLERTYSQTAWLWDELRPLDAAKTELESVSTVWVVEYRGSADDTSGQTVDTLREFGFVESRTALIHRTEIHELTRRTI